MNAPQELGFIAACKAFFGFLPGQTMLEFRDEVQKLTDKDRAEIREGLIQNGLNVKPL